MTHKSRKMDIRLHSLMRHYIRTYSTTKRLSPFLSLPTSLPPSLSSSLSPSTGVVAIKASVCGAKDSRICDGMWLVGKANSEEIEKLVVKYARRRTTVQGRASTAVTGTAAATL